MRIDVSLLGAGGVGAKAGRRCRSVRRQQRALFLPCTTVMLLLPSVSTAFSPSYSTLKSVFFEERAVCQPVQLREG